MDIYFLKSYKAKKFLHIMTFKYKKIRTTRQRIKLNKMQKHPTRNKILFYILVNNNIKNMKKKSRIIVFVFPTKSKIDEISKLVLPKPQFPYHSLIFFHWSMLLNRNKMLRHKLCLQSMKKNSENMPYCIKHMQQLCLMENLLLWHKKH